MAKFINQDTEENLIHYWGMKSAIDTAVETAVEAAVEVAVKATIASQSIEIAKKMILAGSTDEFISEITGLALEQIQKLRKEENI